MSKAPIAEADFQQAVKELAELNGWKYVHFHDSRRGVPDGRGGHKLVGDKDARGWPDVVLIRERALFRELKADGKQLTQSQADMIKRMTLAGLDADVWRPADWDKIAEILGASRG